MVSARFHNLSSSTADLVDKINEHRGKLIRLKRDVIRDPNSNPQIDYPVDTMFICLGARPVLLQGSREFIILSFLVGNKEKSLYGPVNDFKNMFEFVG